MAATRSSAVTNRYSDTFESYPVGTPLVDGINYWYASETNIIVQSDYAPPGSTNAAVLPFDTTLSNRYSIAKPTNVWIHLEVSPVRYDSDEYPVADSNAAALFYLNSNGYFVVYDGLASAWVTITRTVYGETVTPIGATDWVTNLDVFVDYSNKTWQISMGALLLTNNIGFANASLSSLNGFDAYNGNNTTYLDNVSIYDQAPFAKYDVRPRALTNWVAKGGTATPQTFDIVGAGVRPSDYTIVTNDSATWPVVTPGSGTITNEVTNVTTVSYASALLAPGTHTSLLSVATSYGFSSTQTVALTLNVMDLLISTNYLTSACMYGYAPASQTFDIVMSDASAPSFAITTNIYRPWMSVTPGTGTLTEGTHTFVVDFSTNELDVGVHSSVLDVVTTKNGINMTQQVTVVASVFSRPIPTVSWTNYSQTFQLGLQPVETNIVLNNSGAVPRAYMNYAVTSDVAWLLVNTNGLCTNGEDHIISVQFANMATNKGTNIGHLTFQTVDAGTGYAPIGQASSVVQVAVQVFIIGDPGTPYNLTSTAGTDTGGIQLNWLTTATNVNHFEVWRATTNILSAATKIADFITDLAYYDAAVEPGYKQWYWVRAINDFGGAGDFTAATMGWRFLPAPTGLTATSGTLTNCVALNWSGAFGAKSYEIWRGIYTNVGLAARIGTVSPTVTAYNDTTAEVNLNYYYWVRSRTPDMGNYSAVATGFRAALLKPANISASKGTFNSKIRIMWQAVQAATKYEVWRSTDSNLGNATRIGTVTIQGYDDIQANASHVYYYWVKAHDAQGFPSPFSELDTGWLQLTTPAGIAATQGTRPYSVRISWAAVENATSYEVVRSASPGANVLAQTLADTTPLARPPSLDAGISAASETSRTFFDDNATFAGASYLYKVRAKNALGSSEFSGEVIGWRQVRKSFTTKQVANDYDGDKISDVVLFAPDSARLRVLCTTLGEYPVAIGDVSCVPVQGDYDGDGLADPMVYSAEQSYWRVMMSSLAYAPVIQATFGGPGQLAAAADYDGDQLTDVATYQASTATLRALLSGSQYAPAQTTLGGPGYVVACADYDGDGKADPAVYSATDGLLRIRLSSAEYFEVPVSLGGAGLIFVPGDFDGDGQSDLTTYNETTGTLAVKLSSAKYAQVNLAIGGPGYAWIVPADYDGDGLLDPAAFSQTDGWAIMFSSLLYATMSDTFGGANNVPFVP